MRSRLATEELLRLQGHLNAAKINLSLEEQIDLLQVQALFDLADAISGVTDERLGHEICMGIRHGREDR